MRTAGWLLVGTCLGGWGLGAQAQSLQELHAAAKTYDATYLAAQAQYQANLAKAEQAKAGLLPTAGVAGSGTRSNVNSDYSPADKSYGNRSVQLSASQPLYRPANSRAQEQAEQSLLAATAQLEAASQELILRTSQAYFDVLAAQDTLAFVQAQKSAVAEQLAAAKRNFEVGAATITDTREAQARFDQTRAQEIAADNDWRVKRLALDQLVGKASVQPWALAHQAPFHVKEPAELETWLDNATTGHPQVRQAIANLDIAKLEVKKAEAAHLPTVDAIASYQYVHTPGTAPAPTYLNNKTATLGIQFNLPLFAGYSLQNRVQETVALQEKAYNDLDAARRAVAQTTRAAYYGVISAQGQVEALEAAEASSQSALDATKLGYQVGVRINLDVLNAQSQLYQTKASLAKARYDLLLGGLKLKQASGILKEVDLQDVNRLLHP